MRFHNSSKSKYKRTHNVDRAVGGVNTMFLGDFWQLRPTGLIALMSNPFAAKAQENARAREIMGMFWFSGLSFSLQPWESNTRMIHVQKINAVEKTSGSALCRMRVEKDACNRMTGISYTVFQHMVQALSGLNIATMPSGTLYILPKFSAITHHTTH